MVDGGAFIDVYDVMLVFEGETLMQHCKHGDTELPHRSRFGLVQTLAEPLRAGVATGT